MLNLKGNTSNFLKAAFEDGVNGIILLDVHGCIIDVNIAAEQILNKPQRDLIARPIQQVVPSGLLEILKSGQAFMNQRVFINERSYIFNSTPVISKGRMDGTVIFLQDISRLQFMEEELETTRNFTKMLETVLDNDYECIVGVDAEARIIMINDAYCKLLAKERPDILGRDVEQVIENTRLQVVLQTGQSEIGQIQRINGRDAIVSRIPLKLNGKVWAAVGKVMFRDVSEMRSLLKRVELLQSELEYYKKEIKNYQGTRYSIDNIIGNSPGMSKLKKLTQRVARNDSTVLIRGESGTGKELFAHALHNLSPRAHYPFIKVNCAALPENLLESELFGYQEGAFTGASKKGKPGKFELAHGGTIFLDEIGDMPLNMQVKLLRVIQEKEVERLGSSQPVEVDIRLVTATNRNLEEMVEQGTFREDLFYRINVVVLNVPPLRERIDDIPTLTECLMKRLAWQLGCPQKILGPSALKKLLDYHWPGNVRELENILERLLNIIEDDLISANHVEAYLHREKSVSLNQQIKPLKESIIRLEKTQILNALEVAGGNRLEAAKLLKISKSSFYDKMSKYKID